MLSILYGCRWKVRAVLVGMEQKQCPFIKLTNIMNPLCTLGHQSEFIWSKLVGVGWYRQLGVLSWSLSFGPKENSWDTVARMLHNSNGNHTIWQDQQSWGVSVVRDPNRDTMECYPDQVNDPKGTRPWLDGCRLVELESVEQSSTLRPNWKFTKFQNLIHQRLLNLKRWYYFWYTTAFIQLWKFENV